MQLDWIGERMHSFLRSFVFAFAGLLYGITAERHVKFHILAMVIVVVAGIWTGLSSIEWMILIILFAGMISLELMNTAIERTVDLVTLERHPLAKAAKDVAAAAVLVFAMACVVIGCIIFLPKWL